MRTSKLWIFGPPFALLISALVYYVKFPGFRDWTDRNIPWVKENVAPRLPALRESIEQQVRTHSDVKSLVTDLVSPTPDPAPAIGVPAEPAKKSYVLKDGSIDLQELAATPADWPKVLSLKKPTQFPAVRDGQVIGTLTAPMGSEVRLVKIHQGKIGVEYQGGGGWIAPEDSNLGEKLQ
ncbi:MAG: hypothetical protein RLZZ253_3315 [Verrucomicrobiota bacterium]|jgi:hypothetical protein